MNETAVEFMTVEEVDTGCLKGEKGWEQLEEEGESVFLRIFELDKMTVGKMLMEGQVKDGRLKKGVLFFKRLSEIERSVYPFVLRDTPFVGVL